MNSLESVLKNPKTTIYIFGCGLYVRVGCQNEMVSETPHLDISNDPFHIFGGERAVIDQAILVSDPAWSENPNTAKFSVVSKKFKRAVSDIYEQALKYSVDEQANQEEDLIKTHAKLSGVDALKFDLVLAGSVLKVKYESIANEYLEEHIDSDEAEFLIDNFKAHLHPFYPAYAVPAITFKSNITDAFIPCNLFNRYGEYIGNQELEVETMCITGIEQEIIPDLGLSPSLAEFSEMYKQAMADEE